MLGWVLALPTSVHAEDWNQRCPQLLKDESLNSGDVADVLLWHAYGPGSREADAINCIARAFTKDTGKTVRTLFVNPDAYTNKLSSAVPRGSGPDVFIGAHDQLGYWAASGIIGALDEAAFNALDKASEGGWFGGFHPDMLRSLQVKESQYGIPLAFKSPVLVYNPKLIAEPPADTEALIKFLDEFTDLSPQDPSKKRYGLIYEFTNFYFHSGWLHGFNGRVFDPESGEVTPFATKENADSFAFVRKLSTYMPHEVTESRLKELFNQEQAAMVITGPWALDGFNGIDFKVAPLPVISTTGKAAAPFATVEGVFLSGHVQAARREAALSLMRYAAGEPGALIRATVGGQPVAHMPTYKDPAVKDDPIKQAFLAQLKHTVPMSSHPTMSAAWEPLNQALRTSVTGAPYETTEPYWLLIVTLLLASAIFFFFRMDIVEPQNRLLMLIGAIACLGLIIPIVMHLLGQSQEVATPLSILERADTQYKSYLAPPAEPENPAPYVVFLCLGLGGIAFWMWRKGRLAFKRDDTNLVQLKLAAAFASPTIITLMALVIIPFVIGAGMSFFAHQNGEFVFVGLRNFARVFSGENTGLSDTLSFYFTLIVTILWTALNVVLHVAIGVVLALMLRDPMLKLRGVYRVLLIVPWAVPNYITALIWRGMFDAEVGAINGILTTIGLEPVYWFDRFLTGFAANLATNTWLGFPFMMVVTLGALQAIPKDLEDAASVDGASRWQRLRHVTLPLLRPALLPAIILGSVWTFNMFNIIYLVSGGTPNGATEILISDAYKWAFERQFQYGYAAAYALLIFFILLGYSRLTRVLVGEDA